MRRNSGPAVRVRSPGRPAGLGRLVVVRHRLLLIPGAPLLVPELSGADPAAARLRAACVAAAGAVLADGPRPLIVRRPDDRFATTHTGSFRAWGADVDVAGGNHLPELVARWVIGAAGRDAGDVDLAAQLPDPFDFRDVTVDGEPRPIVVVAEGPAALTARAPLTLLDGAQRIDDICAAIAAGDDAALAEGSDPFGDVGPSACAEVGLGTVGVWQDLAAFGAALRMDARDFTAHATYRDASHGVGYHVAEWGWTA